MGNFNTTKQKSSHIHVFGNLGDGIVSASCSTNI